MSDIEILSRVEAQPFLYCDVDRARLAEYEERWQQSGITTRVVRGGKSRDLQALFDEWSAALQFPTYFGENWAAFDECLSDMEWLGLDKPIVILVTDATELLSESDADLRTLVKLCFNASLTYSEAVESGNWWDRAAVAFHVILQTNPENSRWQEAGVRAPLIETS